MPSQGLREVWSAQPVTETDAQSDYRYSHMSASKAPAYDAGFRQNPWRAWLWQREKRILDRVISGHFGERPFTHLDVACGTGRILEHLAARTLRSTGIDISPAMLAMARRKLPTAELVLGDISRPQALGDRAFDLITAFRFFPNAQHELRRSAMQNAVRHLSRDGILVFNNHRNDSAGLFRLARLLGKRSPTMKSAEALELIRSCGLEPAAVHPIGVLPATDDHMLVPGAVHRLSDTLAKTIGIAQCLAQDIVFVCRRAGANPTKES